MASAAASLLACVVSVVVILLLPACSRAFDTGSHSDLTRNSLDLYGYSRDAQKLGAFSNWATDLYAFTPQRVAGLSVVPDYIPELETFHCNNLYNIVFGANYMARLVLNTRNAVQDAVRRGQVLDYLAILGTSLHVYQDFYSHSNWASLQLRSRCDCYQMTGTLFDSLTRAKGSVEAMVRLEPQYSGFVTYSYLGAGYPYFNVFSGNIEHGDYCRGINADSYVRPRYEETYAYAFAGSVEWIYNYERWAAEADASFVAKAKSWAAGNLRTVLNRDYNASFEISYAATKLGFDETDGHWKGAGSADASTFVLSTSRFASDDNDPLQNLYLRHATPPVWSLLSTPSLYSFLNTSRTSDGNVGPDTASLLSAAGNFTSFQSLPANYTNLTAVVVRTTSFTLPSNFWAFIGGRPSPWALITVDGFEIKEAPMHDTLAWTPFWTAIKFVPMQSQPVQIQYTLVTAASNSAWGKTVPIAPRDGTLDVAFNIMDKTLSGDATGVHDTFATALSSSASGSQVKIYFDARPLQCGSRDTVGIVAFCKNTAYGELGSFPTCDGSKLRPMANSTLLHMANSTLLPTANSTVTSGGHSWSPSRWLWTHSVLLVCIYLFIHV